MRATIDAMKSPDGFVFAFRKDARLLGLLDTVLLGLAATGVILIMTGGWAAFWVGVGLLVMGLFVILLAFPSYYKLSAESLLIRAGPLRWRIPLSSIRRIETSRSQPCASAWAFESLKIHYVQGAQDLFILVAPKDRSTFLQKLSAACPGAQLVDSPRDCREG
jgi:hypothetical protein